MKRYCWDRKLFVPDYMVIPISFGYNNGRDVVKPFHSIFKFLVRERDGIHMLEAPGRHTNFQNFDLSSQYSLVFFLCSQYSIVFLFFSACFQFCLFHDHRVVRVVLLYGIPHACQHPTHPDGVERVRQELVTVVCAA